jgi:hypothetical protein
VYCSNCGGEINKTHRFCLHCGQKLKSTSLSKPVSKSFNYSFTSKLLLGGNFLTPDKLLLDENGVTYQKRNKYLVGVDESFLAYSSISYVKIDRGIINATIIISSKGSQAIRAANFSLSDARKIEKIIKFNL